jgi:hypothetical protein
MSEMHDYGTILPGQGIAEVRFGMTPSAVKRIVGEPEEMLEDDFEDGTESHSYVYSSLGLVFDFGSEDGYVLDTIRIERDDIRLFDRVLTGMSADEVVGLFRANGEEVDEEAFCFEDDDGNEGEVLEFEGVGVSVWCVNGEVTSVQISHLWADDETPIYPELGE